MSYCRFTEGDVYAYECDFGVQFVVIGGKENLDRLCRTFNEAYQYAKVLRDTHGLDVPDHAIEALKADALEEAARTCGPDSAVAELKAENAKLRGLVRAAWKCIHTGVSCYDCRLVAGGCTLQSAMRELGVVE